MQKTATRFKDSRNLHHDVDSVAWKGALARVADIKAILGEGELSDDIAKSLACRWKVSVRTVWRTVRAYRTDGSIRGILKKRPGSVPGTGRMSPAVESVIRSCTIGWWKQTENASIAEIYPSIVKECAAKGLEPPSRATVARRLATLRLDPANFSPEVAKHLREKRRLVKCSYVVDSSLDVVQVDHTVADVFIVDASSRKCIGRPTLTVAVDVATRCVTGICLSLESPSSLVVALCLQNSISPKSDWLVSIGCNVRWPMLGVPKALHVDNGREFHSAAFRRGCDLNGIDTIYRPPGTPRFGGHVERLIGTLMRRVRLLPGNTYSDFLGKRPDRAESKAALTLNELSGFLVEDIERYHLTTHRSLGRSPLAAWEREWTGGLRTPRVPDDLARFKLDFLPLQRRVIGREGIELFGLKYSCQELASEVRLGQPREIRFDPRDISRVYLEQPESAALTVPLRDKSLPAMSLWELQAIKLAEPGIAARCEAQALERILKATGEGETRKSGLRSERLSARRKAWKDVQRLAALDVPDTKLRPTMTSEEIGSLPWEILE